MKVKLFDLAGKVAIVTGASRGIGESIALALAAYGAHVIVASRSQESCERVVASIKKKGGSAEAIACNIGELSEINSLFSVVDGRHGRLDILVNNAATNPYFGHVLETSAAAFQKTLDVNIRGYFFSSVAAAKIMAKNGSGSIVNIASVNAMVPGEDQAIYSITKAAVLAMTKAFAKECALDGVRVNALLPGPTNTRFASGLVHDPARLNTILSRVPMGRVAEPEEMVGAVLYLVSAASTYTTGACIPLDGGYLLT